LNIVANTPNTPNLRLESDLLRRLRAREDGAAADLVDGYRGRVYQLALRYVRSPEDAEEVTQDVLFKAVERIDDFRGDAALSSWLYRITFNTAMTRLRQMRAARAPQPLSFASDANAAVQVEDVVDWSALADEVALRRQLQRRMVYALGRLPAIYRAAVILRDVRGLTTEEASTVLRLKEQTLKSRLHRGRLLLRRELADFASGLRIHRTSLASA
jgi:RNA polymerase sigma-70 factor (ECF subfamily)